MQGTEPVQDPLSAPVIAEVETAPTVEKRPSTGLLSFFGAGPSTSSRPGSVGRTEDSDSEVDNFSAIGQLVGPPSTDESALYERVTRAPNEAKRSMEKPEFHICVTDPRRADQPGFFGLNSAYTQYKITTTRKNTEFVVWRRFREFVALDATLVEKFRGYIVPPRPEKNVVEAHRMKGAFIQERRLALEKYLNKLAMHPQIKNCEELRVFLEMEGGLGLSLRWRALQPTRSGFFEATSRFSRQLFGRESAFIRPNEVTNTGKRTGNFMRMMREGVQNVKNEMKGAQPMSSDEKILHRKAQYVDAKWDQLTEVSRAAEFYVKKFDRMSGVLGDSGLSLIRLSKYEEESGMELARYTQSMQSVQALTANTKQSGIALIRLARLARKVTGKMAQDLSEIHEYLFMMPSIQRALAARDYALLTLQVVKKQRASRQKRLEELKTLNEKKLGGYASKTRRIKYVSEQIETLDETVSAAEQEYERVKIANFKDLERYDKQRAEDFVAMVHSLACVQAAYAERCAEVWVEIAKALGADADQVQTARHIDPSSSRSTEK